jgi:hypothetical protein
LQAAPVRAAKAHFALAATGRSVSTAAARSVWVATARSELAARSQSEQEPAVAQPEAEAAPGALVAVDEDSRRSENLSDQYFWEGPP